MLAGALPLELAVLAVASLGAVCASAVPASGLGGVAVAVPTSYVVAIRRIDGYRMD